jgi:hypothetical protein
MARTPPDTRAELNRADTSATRRAPARRSGQPGSQDEKLRDPVGPGRLPETGEPAPGGSAPAGRTRTPGD